MFHPALKTASYFSPLCQNQTLLPVSVSWLPAAFKREKWILGLKSDFCLPNFIILRVRESLDSHLYPKYSSRFMDNSTYQRLFRNAGRSINYFLYVVSQGSFIIRAHWIILTPRVICAVVHVWACQPTQENSVLLFRLYSQPVHGKAPFTSISLMKAKHSVLNPLNHSTAQLINCTVQMEHLLSCSRR